MSADRIEYNYSVEECDVSIEKRDALKEYRRIRQECLEHIRGPSVFPIFAQLQKLAYSTALYQTLNEARRLEPDAPANGPLWDLLTEGYVSVTSLGIRRLLDVDKRRISLAWVISRIERNLHLFTREFYVCHDGLPYEYQDTKDQFYANFSSSLKQTESFLTTTGRKGWYMSEEMHDHFDSLCGHPAKRSRDDRISVDVVSSLKNNFGSESIASISNLANKFIAHTVIHRPGEIQIPTHEDVFDALSILMNMANEISASIFWDANVGAVVPLYRGDPIEALDHPWISPENHGKLRTFWDSICSQMDEWA